MIATKFDDDIAALWQTFDADRTRSLAWRLDQLDGIRRFLTDHADAIVAAVQEDLGRPQFEAYAAEVGAVLSELRMLRKALPKLMRPRRLRTPLRAIPSKTWLVPEPYGVVLVMPAWNFPVALGVVPMVGALAAGNAVVLKPSELAPASSRLVARELPRYVDQSAVRVIEGGADVAEALLEHRFGHIHYTGGSIVARSVMRAAAAHLTPVTLELGGQNPVYVHGDTDIEITARRIFWGRLMNAGQVCLAPNYVLVNRPAERALVDAMVRWVHGAYGPDPQRSPDLARIVNERHFNRIVGLLESAGEIVVGGQHDAAERYIAPTIVRNVPDDHPILGEEIFGPVLPVVAVDGPEDAISRIRRNPQPLASYVFTENDDIANRFVEATSSGALVINQVFIHAANPAVPLGGVGESGMGSYTGLDSFECFSHLKPVMKSPMRPDPSILYPPYARWKERLVRLVLR